MPALSQYLSSLLHSKTSAPLPQRSVFAVLSRLSDEFGEAIALTVELGGVFGQFSLACPPLLEQDASEDESLDLKDNAFDLLVHGSSSLLRRGAAARLRRSMLGLKKLVHEAISAVGAKT
jgi:hypothetical protein